MARRALHVRPVRLTRMLQMRGVREFVRALLDVPRKRARLDADSLVTLVARADVEREQRRELNAARVAALPRQADLARGRRRVDARGVTASAVRGREPR